MSPAEIAAIVLAVCAFTFGWMTHRGQRRIKALQRQLATALGIIGERDDNLREYDARNERLHHDLKAMRDRFPRLSLDEPVVDEDVTRRYIQDYGDPWKDQLR